MTCFWRHNKFVDAMTCFWLHDKLLWHTSDVMTNLLTSRRVFDVNDVFLTCLWHHDLLFEVCCTFGDVMTDFVTASRVFVWYTFWYYDVFMSCQTFWSYDKPFGIMMCLWRYDDSLIWQTVWRHDVFMALWRFFDMTNCLTSWRVYGVMTILWYDKLIDIMTCLWRYDDSLIWQTVWRHDVCCTYLRHGEHFDAMDLFDNITHFCHSDTLFGLMTRFLAFDFLAFD